MYKFQGDGSYNNNMAIKTFISDEEMDALVNKGKAKVPDFIPDAEADKYFGTQTRPKSILDPTFPATGKETPLQAGLKSAGNLPTSALRFGKGVADIALNPVDTLRSVAGAGAGALQQSVLGYGNALTGQNKRIDNQSTQTFDSLVDSLKERYGSLDALQKTAINDPFGFGTDILSLVAGGAGLAGKTGTLAKGIGATGKVATAPIKAGASKIAGGVEDTVKFSASQLTGLNQETISSILKDPGALKKANPEIRMQTAQAVGDALDTRLEELSGLGKGYEAIRNQAIPVTIPKNIVPNVLNKYGVKLDGQGRIITTPESRPLSPTDRTALQDFIDNYGSQTNLSSNSFLNVREALSNLSKFEQGKTSLPQQIARDLRGEYDAIGKSQIPGLKNLDIQYAPERQLLSQLRKDIFDSKTGDLKDGAISKIANITGKGKENLLERVKQVVPDIEQRVNLIKTVEDIERANGFKTGAYIRGAITGGGVLTGNVPLMISSILAQPQIAVPLLKGFGYTGQKARPILEAIKNIANDVNNFKIPSPLLDSKGKLKAGMSIEDVSKTNPLSSSIQKAKASGQSLKYKTTVNIQDKNDLEYLGRILSEDNINDIKTGKMTNFRGTPYEDLAKVNIISETPKTVAQQLEGKIKDIKLKSDTFYHGTSAGSADSIMSSNFKLGSQLPENAFRGGGYGRMQSSISLTETPKDASRFSDLTRDGKIIEVKLKPNSKVVSIKGIEDATDLEDYISYLKKEKIDAVYIGGGEKELVIINPKAVTPIRSQLKAEWDKINPSAKNR